MNKQEDIISKFKYIWNLLDIQYPETYLLNYLESARCQIEEFPSITPDELYNSDLLVCDYFINTNRFDLKDRTRILSGMIITAIKLNNKIEYEKLLVWRNDISLNPKTFKYFLNFIRTYGEGEYYYEVIPKSIFLPVMSTLYKETIDKSNPSFQYAEILLINAKRLNEIEFIDYFYSEAFQQNIFLCKLQSIQFYIINPNTINVYLEPLGFDIAAEFYLKINKFKEENGINE